MYKPYKMPIVKAYANLRLPQPKVSKFLIPFLRPLGRLYLFLFYGMARFVLLDDRLFFDVFKRALAGESRCIIAFRHPNGGEPQLLSWFFLFKLKGLAARKGVRFALRPHAVFLYTYEVVRWGGWPARFLMPRIGAMPVHHAKMDSQGMTRILKAIVEGPYPLALAPEGQVSYVTDVVPRLEPGVIRIGFNAAQRLAGKGENCQGNPCPVEILPVSVYFRYGAWGRLAMELLLRKIEKVTGFSRKAGEKPSFAERLRQCRDHVLEVNETRYQIKGDASRSFEERLEAVTNAALETAERMLGIKGEGESFARMYRVRQLCWDRIYLPELDTLENITRVKRNTLDLRAGEAWYIGRHQEIVDFCWYFRCPLPTEETALHTRIEYVQNLWEFANRTMGGAFTDRKSIFPKKVIIQAAPVINLSERLPSFAKDKKATVAAAMADLEKAYLNCIDEANRMEKD